MTKLENVLIWLYVKTWGKFGDHIIEQDLWNFGTRDLETALIGLAYPRKRKTGEEEKIERVQALNDLIMGRFEKGGLAAFREWSGEIHNQFIESFPETTDPDSVDEETTSQQQQRALVKIMKWDQGQYSRSVTDRLFQLETSKTVNTSSNFEL